MKYFLAAALPAENPMLLPNLLNWAYQNNFKVAHIVNTLMPAPNNGGILKPGKQQMGVTPMNMVYIETTETAFIEYFGYEYSEDKLPEIPRDIAKKEKGNFCDL